MNEWKSKLFISISIFTVAFCALAVFWYYRGSKTATPVTISEAQAIETIQNRFPELREYPSDTLAPKSIKAEKAVGGWYVAFIQEGSGRPIIFANCYFVDNASEVSGTGVHSPKYSEYGIDDISLKNCQPKDSNPKPGGEIPPIPKESCALETCHGFNTITCGPNPPDACTEIYEIGDKCLQYATCGVQNGTCQQIQNTQFTRCASCVQACIDANKNDTSKLFECENTCN